jgi:hypothetical protein
MPVDTRAVSIDTMADRTRPIPRFCSLLPTTDVSVPKVFAAAGRDLPPRCLGDRRRYSPGRFRGGTAGAAWLQHWTLDTGPGSTPTAMAAIMRSAWPLGGR